MKKVLILIGILVLGMAAATFGQESLDAPHNITWDPTETTACPDCHNYFTGGAGPAQGGYTDAVCLRCHINDTGGGYTKTNAPAVITHSSAAITAAGLTPNAAYGTWGAQCIDCHWTLGYTSIHGQLQTYFNGSPTFLLTGSITSITTDSVNDQTTFGYNNITQLQPGWTNYSSWNAKTGVTGRGLIFYASTGPQSRLNFEVVSATATTITVRGNTNRVYPGLVTVGSTFALTYGQFIRSSVNNVGTNESVVFDNNQGPNSFAYDESGTGTDPTPNGICQVCHTLTNHWRSDGTRANHNSGLYCMECHKHENGFMPTGGACNACHGDPPIDTTSGGPTGLLTPASGSSGPGAHSEHAVTLNMQCTTCHSCTQMPNVDNQIRIGFSINSSNFPTFIGSVPAGGTFDSFSPVSSPYTFLACAPTAVTTTGTNSCTNIYCHSNAQGAGGTGAPTYAKPVWTNPASGECGTCHNADGVQGNGTLMSSGTHTIHVSPPYSKPCNECHNGAGEGTSKHVNNNIDLAFITDSSGNTGSYSNNPNPPGTPYGSCSTVYCHSVVQNNGATPLVAGTNNYATPTWGGSTVTVCSNCHGDPPLTGAHGIHVSDGTTGYGYACGTCHNGAGYGTTLHVNKVIDVVIDPARGASATYSAGSQITPAKGYYGSCSNTYCHSDGTAVATGIIPPNSSPLWSGTVTCGSCHGAGNTTGQPSYANGSPKANSHPAHPTDCSICHYATTTDGTTISTVTGFTVHDSHAYTLQAKSGYSFTYTYQSTGGTCSSISCHSGNNATWGSTIVCGGCHAVPPTTNAHVTHTSALTSTTAVYGAPFTDQPTTTAYGFNCGECHPLNTAEHGDGILEVSLSPTGAPSGSMKAMNQSGASYSVTPGTTQNGTCTGVYCHSDGQSTPTYATTPAWNTTFAAVGGDHCAKCHLNSPGSAAHGAHVVGIHYNDIYTGTTGLATPGTANTSSHGLATVATTINCNVCHNNTVTSDANDQNTACSTCHNGTNAPLQGNAAIANKIYHVNGVADVAFAPAAILSKAQIRDSITTVPDLNSSWSRQNGYKVNTPLPSYDQSQASLTPAYAAPIRTCSSVACHNGNAVNWDATNITCSSCHTGLPQ